MGNDGGSIPTRRELVKSPTAQKTHSQLRTSQTQSSFYHWTYCALSKRPLSSPIVSDPLGRLYNKDALLEWLLHGLEAFGDGEEVLKSRGVKSLKDVVNINFQVLDAPEENAVGSINGNSNGKEEGASGERKERWVCPITRKELGGGVRAVYLVPCGCAFAEGAIKETTGAGKEGQTEECLQCGKGYNPRDVININPTAEADIARLQNRMKELAEFGLTHSLKKVAGEKSKKRKAKEADGQKATPTEEMNGKVVNGKSSNGKSSTNGDNIKNSATAKITSKVLADEQQKAKIRKVEASDAIKSLFTSKAESKDRGKGKGGGDFMTRGYSLPK
ncbi:Rtf2 RING-finger-domain-containing protein [Peziza echinospora]|nr:Rtf2 RING-finger-domain-containing protein [Peziza echinospora]